jgi:tetratricopeptide (TPR) repeat protein
MASEITVSERILFHLGNYVKYEDKFEVPFDVTQDGISQACGISRAHAAIELKKLRESNIVEERLSHVRRGKARRKVYFLTVVGKPRAKDVQMFVRQNGIEPMVDASKVSPGTPSRHKAVRRSSPLPSVREFFGRQKELESISTALSSPSFKIIDVRGIPGIGKTTLVAKAVSGVSGERVFWHSARPWDSNVTLADALGRFFSDNGDRRLAAYLSSGGFELGDLSFLLNQELAENGYIFVFDDADVCPSLQDFLKMFRHSCGAAKIVTTSENRPGFYDTSDKVARKEVFEIELGGLDVESAVALLKVRGIEGHIAVELAKVTHGHPLSLEMVTASSPVEAKYQVSQYFEEKFYGNLSDGERSLLQFASVFQQPFPSEAIPRDLRQTRKGSMLRESAPGRFEIHASLRSFVYEAMSREERARWHSAAADFYLRSGEPQERLYHLIKAGRSLEAEMLVYRTADELLAKGNVQRLWDMLGGLTPLKERYRPAVESFKARVASLVGRYDSAWEILERLSRSESVPIRADALVEMGKIESKRGDLAAASRLFTEALEAVDDLPAARSKALRGLGAVESKLGNYSKAQELLERSAIDAMAAMDSTGMLKAHMELGNVFIGMGRYDEAIGHFSKCAAGFGPVELANVYVNMGIASVYLSKPEEARLHLENAVRLADETGQPRCKAYALTSLAEVLVGAGEPEQARERSFRALEILTELGDRIGTSAAYANLGMAERSLGDLAASEEHYKESISALEGMDVPRSLGQRKLEFGQLLGFKGEGMRAREMITAARSLFERVGADDMVRRADMALSEIGQG